MLFDREFVRTVHVVVDTRESRTEGDAAFQMMDISAAANGNALTLKTGMLFVNRK